MHSDSWRVGHIRVHYEQAIWRQEFNRQVGVACARLMIDSGETNGDQQRLIWMLGAEAHNDYPSKHATAELSHECEELKSSVC